MIHLKLKRRHSKNVNLWPFFTDFSQTTSTGVAYVIILSAYCLQIFENISVKLLTTCVESEFDYSVCLFVCFFFSCLESGETICLEFKLYSIPRTSIKLSGDLLSRGPCIYVCGNIREREKGCMSVICFFYIIVERNLLQGGV